MTSLRETDFLLNLAFLVFTLTEEKQLNIHRCTEKKLGISSLSSWGGETKGERSSQLHPVCFLKTKNKRAKPPSSNIT